MPFHWKKETWPAKVLVFGEYGVLDGCSALGLPLPDFQLKAKFLSGTSAAPFSSDIERVWRVLAQNQQPDQPTYPLVIDSTIPMGMGLGSSAALCLALLQLGEKTYYPRGLSFQQRFSLLRKMESVYHTTSSGVDLLICAARGPVLVNMQDRDNPSVNTTQIPEALRWMLLDVGTREEKNSTFIPKVMRRFKENTKELNLWDRYKQLTTESIEVLTSGRSDGLYECLTQLRQIQEQVGMLSPQVVHVLPRDKKILGWKALGAGGGGLILVFARPEFRLPLKLPYQVVWQGIVGGL